MNDMTTAIQTTDETTRETPDAPRALGEGDAVDVDLNAFGLETPEVEVPPAAEPAPETPAVAETARAERSEGDKDKRVAKARVSQALRESRDETREARQDAERWRQIAEQAKGHANANGIDPALNLRTTVPILTDTVPRLSDSQRRQLVEAARQAPSFGEPTEALLNTVEQMFSAYSERVQRALVDQAMKMEQAFNQQHIARLERRFTRDHSDYYDVARRSGIGDMIAIDPATGRPGPRFNREVAQAIADADDPVEATYEIARHLLGDSSREDDLRPSRSPSPTDRTPAEPTRATPTTAELAEAERRGAQRVAERVATNNTKPQGGRTLAPAGTPKPQWKYDDDFRKYLDDQMKVNPMGVMAYFEKHPQDRQWWERGGSR